MPNISIYVGDQDTPLFEAAKERAKEIGQPLSGLLARALREYLDLPRGFTPVTLRIGEGLTEHGSGTFRTIRFEGRLLAEQRVSPLDLGDFTESYEEFAVYETSKGKLVVVRERRIAEEAGAEIFERRNRVFDVVPDVQSLMKLADQDVDEGMGIPPTLALFAREALMAPTADGEL